MTTTTDLKGATLAEVIQLAVEGTGVSEVAVEIRPRLLADNGSGYISGVMAEYLRAHAIRHIRTAPHHPQTTGKTERYHRTLKDDVTLVVHLTPEELRAATAQFVDHYNRLRLHEALRNVTPDDVWYGRREEILARRRALKVKIVLARRYYSRGLTQQRAEGEETPEPVASSTPRSVPVPTEDARARSSVGLSANGEGTTREALRVPRKERNEDEGSSDARVGRGRGRAGGSLRLRDCEDGMGATAARFGCHG